MRDWLHRCAVAGALLACVGTAACDLRSPAEEKLPDIITVSLGPMPPEADPDAKRIQIAVPTRYLNEDLARQYAGRQLANRVMFVVRLKDFSPATGRSIRDEPGFLGLSFGYAAHDWIKGAVLNTKLSHFSIYNKPSPNEFGLQVKKGQLDFERLLTHIDGENYTMIECAWAPSPNRPQFCQMWDEQNGEPLIDAVFRETDLPQWKHIRDGSRALARTWLAPN